MRRLLMVCALVMMPALATAEAASNAALIGTVHSVETWGADDAGEMQSTPNFVLGAPLGLAWDAVANEAESATNRYELRVDSLAIAAITPVGRASYLASLVQSQLTLGAHTVNVRACSAEGCGEWSSLPFNIVRPLPGTVPNLRFSQPAPVALALPQAIDYVQAYALWAIDRRLTDGELGWLAARHGNVTPTKASVAATLNAVYAELAGVR